MIKSLYLFAGDSETKFCVVGGNSYKQLEVLTGNQGKLGCRAHHRERIREAQRCVQEGRTWWREGLRRGRERGREPDAPTLSLVGLLKSLGFLKISISHLLEKTSSTPRYSKY